MDAGTAGPAVARAPAPVPLPPSSAAPPPPVTVPPVPAAPPQQPLLGLVSRYRTLRGKSVSSTRARAFDVFNDNEAEKSLKDQNHQSPSIRALRRRSKSVTSAAPGPRPADASASWAAGLPVDIPPIPTNLPLRSRPVNLHILNSSRNLNKLRSPASTCDLRKGLGNEPENIASPATLGKQNKGSTNPPVTTAVSTVVVRPNTDALEAVRLGEELARLDAENARILEEQKKLDLARLQTTLKTPPPKPKRLILDKLTFLSRGKWSSSPKIQTPLQPDSPSTIAPTVFSLDFSRATTPESSSSSPDRMNFIEQGGKGIVPQTDAPTSASNGGDRRVTVRYLSSTVNLPVNNDTSPVDIVYSTANLVSHPVDPSSCIIVECYVLFGLERRLRRYERIRDVMNSWDQDHQNSLLVMPLDGSENMKELEVSAVRRTQEPPHGFTAHLFHSSKPGRWNKRWVTLSETGAMFASKRPEGSSSDKDSIALCHLSDFDIYTPKESEMRRHLKPPKKICYAIKSQQKTTVFSSGDNFVHFFSTDDEELAQRFRDTVHAWRSWYLVNKQVDLQKKDKAPRISAKSSVSKKGTSVAKEGGHRLKVSVDETPYTIGKFQPLMDMSRFDKPIDEFGKDFFQAPPTQPAQAQSKDTPEVDGQKNKALTATQTRQQPQFRPQAKVEETFSSGGLLGAAYDKRKQDEKAGPTSPKQKQDGPFTEGPSLLNGIASSPSTPEKKKEPAPWLPSAAEHTARTRSQSIRSVRRPATADAAGHHRREKPQPLLNLTTKFPEPPRPPFGGRAAQGHGIRPSGGGPLIDFAKGGAASNPFPGGPPRGAVPRSNTRVVSPGEGPLTPTTPSPATRPRSRSTVSNGPSSSRRMAAEGQPPIPPLPTRSMRRDPTAAMDSSRGRGQMSSEPLVNRAR